MLMDLSMILMAAAMLPWAYAYLWFPRLIGQILEGVPVEGTLFAHVARTARFVRACALSHIVMAVAETAMLLAMHAMEWAAALAWLRLAVVGTLLWGGFYSIYAVAKLSQHRDAIRALLKGPAHV